MKKYLLLIIPIVLFFSCEDKQEKDCAGVEGGTAVLDNCDNCVGGNTGETACTEDCNGDFGGVASVDSCGTCDDDITNNCVQDCADEWGGTATTDNCGTCDSEASNDCAEDCAGEWGGDAIIDDCGVCNGNNANMDCLGICNGTAIVDCFGECNGTAIVDCFGECGGDNYIDECGICNSDISDDCPVIDIDGNEYQYVKIGSKIWMSENLKVSKYNNGESIPTNFSGSEWINLNYGACATYPYDNDQTSLLTCGTDCSDSYGYLYNYYVVMEDDLRGICPEGWHVSTNQEWHDLTEYLEEDNVGGKLKECTEGSCPESEYWWSPNVGATNESGFSALPSGFRDCCSGNDSFRSMGGVTFFWNTSTGYRRLNENNGDYFGHYAQPKYGFSIRCVKD